MPGFAARVNDFWSGATATARVTYRDEALTLLIDPAVDELRRVSIMRRVDGSTTVILSPRIAELTKLDVAAELTESLVLAALTDAGIALYDADNVFYFGDAARDALIAEPDAANVRKLDAGDAASFAEFEAAASEQDREDSFVELDHWAVFGAFDGERLVAAASAYPWGGAALADIGVLTLPGFRGRGFARQLVRALSRFAFSQGYEPQYRCQLDNVASIAVAGSTELTLFGTWQVASSESDT